MDKLLFFLLVLLASCAGKPNVIDRTLTDVELAVINKIPSFTQGEGQLTLQTNCYTCHNPSSASHDDMIAPPLAGIKYNYQKAYPNKELFIAQMSDFIQEPKKETAMMQGPIKRFGLMPKTALSKTEIQQIVLYIFDNKLEVPAWFPEHFEDEKGEPWKN